MKLVFIFAFIFKSKVLECLLNDDKNSIKIDDLKLLEKSGVGLFPDSFYLELFEFEKNFSGSFVKSDKYLVPSASHYLNGKLKNLKFEDNTDHQIYHDKNSKSFATVYLKDNKFKMFARFFDDESQLHFDLIPDSGLNKGKNTHLFIKILDDNKKRSLANEKRGNINNDQLFASDKSLYLKKFKNLDNFNLVKEAKGQKPAILDVETLVVLDPTVYKNHKAFLNSNNDQQIFQHMRRYYAHVFNGVNQKYQNSLENDPDLRINIVLVHIMIMTNTSDATWTDVKIVGDEKIKEYQGKEVILPTKSLVEFDKFVQRQKFTFEFDHAVGMVDKDLWLEDTTETAETRSNLLGVAWTATVCNNSLKYSVNEDGAGFANIYLIAHEIGHNLGSLHDGPDDLNYCNPNDDFIMSPVISYAKITNKQLFSFCSLSYFKQALLLDDGSGRSSCLFNRAKVPSFVESANYAQTGQIWSLDQQCKLQNGQNSRACQNPELQALACSELYCEINGFCSSQYPAVEGSYCGQNKVCRKGLCTSLARSNSATKFCLDFLLYSLFNIILIFYHLL